MAEGGNGRRRGKPTMEDVAAKAGVSRALVSLVFRDQPGASEATRDRVYQAAAELGYRPDTAAQMLARSRTRVIGVMVTMRNTFHADLVDAIYPAAEDLGYDILLSATSPGRDERQAVEALLGHRCEGLLLLGPNLDPEYVTHVGRQAAVVPVGRRYPDCGVSSVHAAESKGVRQVIDHLAELGHRDIVHVDGGDRPGSAERRKAYRTAMRRHGLADHIRVLAGKHTEAAGAEAAQQLLADRTHLPTAVFASNDRAAIGVLDAFQRAGLSTPGDISVAGYDDSLLAQLSHIDLTTVNQNPQRQGELAVRAAVAAIEDPDSGPQDHAVDPKLVIRGTTAQPRG
ncbi:LacI family DNA-binding transcriptional regulator [Actinophytocola sp.]|uniref:LacI family DNA-binding transcriptional regulator n=1 Tax=Actinophytocola sp. TaxID=1872138 RepID=UPI002ED438A4